MMEELIKFVEARDAEMLSVISYDYGLGPDKTHTYYKLEIGLPKHKHIPEVIRPKTAFIHEKALGSSNREILHKLDNHIKEFKSWHP